MYIILGSDGRHYGPVTTGNVIEWIRDGRANLQTKARRADETDWKTLGDFPEFVPTGSTPPFQPETPSAIPAHVPAERATAGLAMENTLPLAGLPRRFFAALIDGLLQWLCWMPASNAMLAALTEHMQTHGQPNLETMLTLISSSIPQSVPYLLGLAVLQTALLCLRSQSVGKLVLGLRIVTVRDDKPGGPLRAYLLRGLLIWMIEQIPLAGKLFWCVDSFCIFREDRRCLHDLLAGTKVVRKTPIH